MGEPLVHNAVENPGRLRPRTRWRAHQAVCVRDGDAGAMTTGVGRTGQRKEGSVEFAL